MKSRIVVVGILLAGVVGVALWPAAVPVSPGAFGWVDRPADVAAAAADLLGFAGTPAFHAAYAGPDDVFLWDAAKAVTGNVLPGRNQGKVGACVGFGAAAAVEHLMCVQIANGSRDEFREVAPEIIYAGSRVEVGGGRISGDGSVGAWAAKFVSQWGVVPRGVFGRFDLREYSAEKCRGFGRTGVPEELETVARKYPVRAVANVKSWDECRAAVRNGYPVMACSSQGFAMVRDADGACRPAGTWAHCMAIVGVRGGRRPGAFLLNSWGETAHSGPRVPADAPAGGFWADAAVIDAMLRQGDSWAFSGFAGFPQRKLDWYAAVPSNKGFTTCFDTRAGWRWFCACAGPRPAKTRSG